MLRAPIDLGGEALLREATRERLADLGDVLVALSLAFRQLRDELRVGLRLEVLEAQVFQLALERLDTETVREWRVDFERLPGDALLRLGPHVLERAHVVEPVAELDEKDADVPRHRDHHLAEVLRLPVFLRREVDLRQLGDAIDQLRNFYAELLGDLIARCERVLDDVVEEARADARRVEPQVRDDPGNAHGVNDVWLSGLPGLSGVHPGAVVVGPLDEVGVDRGLVSPDAFDELFCLEHGGVGMRARPSKNK